MGVFNPGERETFERIATALERIGDGLDDLNNPRKSRDSLASIADSLTRLANPARVIHSAWADPNVKGKRKTHVIPHELGARLIQGEAFRGGYVETITVRSKDCLVVVVE